MRNLKTSRDFSRKGEIGVKAQELKHMARLAERKEKVAECRSSGETVKRWCHENGIAIKTYYYWEKEVLSEAEKAKYLAAAESSRRASFVAVPALPEQRVPEEGQRALAAKVRMRGIEVEIYGGAERETIEQILRVLKDAE